MITLTLIIIIMRMLEKAIMMSSKLFIKTISWYWWAIFYDDLWFFTNWRFFFHL